MNRKTIWICIFSMILLTACGGDSKDKNEETSTLSSTEATETEEMRIADGLPDDLDYNGQSIRILSYENYIRTEDGEDIVSSAAYRTSLAVQERLNVIYELDMRPASDVGNLARQSILAASDDYDIVTPMAVHGTSLSNENLLRGISELPYIDPSKPWWCDNYMSSVALNANDPSVLLGSFSYNYLERSSVIAFNQRLLNNNLDMSADELYHTALSGKWTIDYMQSLSKDFWSDLNGNGKVDIGDSFPFTYNPQENFGRMCYSAGIVFTERDTAGYPVINMNHEETVSLVGKMMSLYQTHGTANLNTVVDENAFVEGRALFEICRFYDVGRNMRDMEDNFGFLPYPKYDESVDGYYSITDSYAMVVCVPITAQDPAFVSTVLEAMASEGYHAIRPIYYEDALKIKYSRDDTASQIVDLITENCRTDFLFLNSLDGLGDIFTTLIQKESSDFASQYSKMEKKALKKLQKLIEAYEES